MMWLFKGAYLYGIIFAAGLSAGIWGTIKLYTAGEVARITKVMEEKDKAYNKGMAALKGLHDVEIEIAKRQVKVKEVIKHVKDDTVCNIPYTTASLLDAHRSGVPDTTSRTPEGTGNPTPDEIISQSQELAAHFDLADRFTKCRKQIVEMNKFYSD